VLVDDRFGDAGTEGVASTVVVFVAEHHQVDVEFHGAAGDL